MLSTSRQALRSLTLAAASGALLLAGPVWAQSSDDGGPSLDIVDSGSEAQVTSGQDTPDSNEVRAEAYNGPKARIAVAPFTDETGGGWYHRQIGDDMADQTARALVNTNRYIVLERPNLEEALYEQDLGTSGRVTEETAAAIGEIEGAELIVTGAVSEFEGSGQGGNWLDGTVQGLFSAFTGGHRQARMAIDLRIIDTKTSRIVAATSVEGEATDETFGAAFNAYRGGSFGGALSSWKDTPTETALRICIRKAVEFIVSKTPGVYYRHDQTVQVAAAVTNPTVPDYAAKSVVRVKSEKLNMRDGPTTGHAVMTGLAQNDPLLVQTQAGDWVQVKTHDGMVGWVAGWLIYPDATMNADGFLKELSEDAAAKIAPEQSAEANVQPAAAANTDSPASDMRAKLKNLNVLYDDGLITEDEYNSMRLDVLKGF